MVDYEKLAKALGLELQKSGRIYRGANCISFAEWLNSSEGEKAVESKVEQLCGLRYKLRYEYDEWVSETQGTLKEYRVSLFPTLYFKEGKLFKKVANTRREAYAVALLWLDEQKESE